MGVILAGEYTDGGKAQLISHGIDVLHVPFNVLAESFDAQGVDLNYPENASVDHKQAVVRQWIALRRDQLASISKTLRTSIDAEFFSFMSTLENSILRKVQIVRIIPLYGIEMRFDTITDATEALDSFDITDKPTLGFHKFEVQVRFSDGDAIDGMFQDKTSALDFLSMF